MFVFDAVFARGEGEETEDFIGDEDEIIYWQGQIERLKEQMKEFEETNPDDYMYDHIYIDNKIQVAQYEYLIQNRLESTHGYKIEFMKFSQYFLLAVYLIIIAFSANLICKEYKTKHVSELYTYPVSRNKIFMSKVAISATYSFVMISLFFAMNAIVMTKYQYVSDVIAIAGKKIVHMTPYQSLGLFYVSSLFAGVSVGIMTMVFSYIVKNNFITIPLFGLVFSLLPVFFRLILSGGSEYTTKLVGQYLQVTNMLIPINILDLQGSPDTIFLDPVVSLLVHSLFMVIAIAIGLIYNKKQNIKV